MTFAAEHRGYGQAVGERVEWENADSSFTKYDYQPKPTDPNVKWLKSWPVAYAKYLGDTTIKRNEQMFASDWSWGTNEQPYLQKFHKREVYICPSDEALVKNVFYPCDSEITCELYGLFSYAINEDVFGITGAGPQGAGNNTFKGNVALPS